MFVDVIHVWQQIHTLYVNSIALGNILPPSEEVDAFYNRLKPFFEKASASVKWSKTHKSNFSKTTEKKNNDTKEVRTTTTVNAALLSMENPSNVMESQ